MIKEFQGPYRFLSNFWPCTVFYDGEAYPSSEAAYQAAKCADINYRRLFKNLKPGEAKRTGRKVKIRSDWEQVKLAVMEQIVRNKFTRNKNLQELLLATEQQELREGNKWGDKFWGVVGNTGLNHLGIILMKIREELQHGI